MATAEEINSSEQINNSSSEESDSLGKVLCSPCNADGKNLGAVGYCVNCKEYLCRNCYTHHRLPSICRRHVLLNQDQMGSVTGRNNSCPEHEKREIQYHCPTHSLFGCHECFYQHQKTCRDSLHIPEVARTLTGSEAFKRFTAKLDHVATKAKSLILKAQQNSESVKKFTADEIAAIKAFKLQIVDAVERLEKDLISKFENVKETETVKWKTVVDKCTMIHEESTGLSAEVEVLQNKSQNTDLYVTMVNSKDRLVSMETDINTTESDNDFKKFAFEGNVDLLGFLQSPWGLGKVVNQNTIDNVDHVTDINVKTGEDSRGCLIRGSAVLPDGQLVLGDYENKNVKLVDAKKNKVISEIKLSSSPWSVTAVTASTVAVTVPDDKKIVFVRTTPALSVDREVATKEECHGLAYVGGKLAVTYSGKNKVELMDLQGAVVREIDTDDIGKALFVNPYAMAVDPRQEVMYVSNYNGENVVCLKLDGSVVATYKDNELMSPHQAVVDSNGMVFVCSLDTKNVHFITPDCKKVKVLLSTAGLVCPVTISYDENSRRLYVGDQNNLKVFRVDYKVL